MIAMTMALLGYSYTQALKYHPVRILLSLALEKGKFMKNIIREVQDT